MQLAPNRNGLVWGHRSVGKVATPYPLSGEGQVRHGFTTFERYSILVVGSVRPTIVPNPACSELALSPASASEYNPTLVIEYWEVSHTFLTPISPKINRSMPQPWNIPPSLVDAQGWGHLLRRGSNHWPEKSKKSGSIEIKRATG